MIGPNEVIIHAGNYKKFARDPMVNGEKKMRGLKPRDFEKIPCGSIPGAPLTAFAKIPRSEWSERIADLRAKKALLSDLRNSVYGAPIKSRDQNGQGYCWAHSTVSCAMLGRAKDGQPQADLSAYAIACIIKNYRNQGGWNGESMKFLRERGCPTSKTWPQQSKAKSNDSAATWEEAARYKMTEWDEIPEKDFDMQITHLLHLMPHALDLNWWSHSIAACDAVDGQQAFNEHAMRADGGKLLTVQEFDAMWETDDMEGAYGIRIWNSWGDGWSDNGMGILTESRAKNNGAISLRVTRAAA